MLPGFLIFPPKLNFNVYIDINNSERARARDKKRPISLDLEKHENSIAAVRKGEMLATSKVKMSRIKKKKSEHKHLRHFLHKTCN